MNTRELLNYAKENGFRFEAVDVVSGDIDHNNEISVEDAQYAPHEAAPPSDALKLANRQTQGRMDLEEYLQASAHNYLRLPRQVHLPCLVKAQFCGRAWIASVAVVHEHST